MIGIGTAVGLLGNPIVKWALGALGGLLIIGGIWGHGVKTGRDQIIRKIEKANIEAMENRKDVEENNSNLSVDDIRKRLLDDALRE